MSGSDLDLRPLLLDGRVVAVAGPGGCAIVGGLPSAEHQLVAAMCLYYREVLERRVPGPFTSRRAEVWARALLARIQQETVTLNGASAGDPSAA